ENGIAFIPLASVSAIGNSTSIQSYAYIDKSTPSSSIVYYRIKQVDFDGKFSYSEIVTLSDDTFPAFMMEVYPNPSLGQNFHVSLMGIYENTLLVLYDVHGKVLYSKTMTYENNGVISA